MFTQVSLNKTRVTYFLNHINICAEYFCVIFSNVIVSLCDVIGNLPPLSKTTLSIFHLLGAFQHSNAKEHEHLFSQFQITRGHFLIDFCLIFTKLEQSLTSNGAKFAKPELFIISHFIVNRNLRLWRHGGLWSRVSGWGPLTGGGGPGWVSCRDGHPSPCQPLRRA